MPQAWFELELTSEYVPYNSFALELDTHAPVISWGMPSGAVEGDTFTIPYTVNEPALISAVLIDSTGQNIPLTVTPTTLTATLPAISGGTAQVVATTRDDLLNEQTYQHAVQLIGPIPEVPEREAGGGRSYTFGPAYKREEFVFDGVVAARRVEQFEFGGTIQSVGKVQLQRERFEFSATTASLRRQSFTFTGARAPDMQLAQALREDEELLLLL